ncbi:hypothetical protein GWK47_005645 [Chionoecetes opilio]|uniref:Uncharacterized protein n=1 Tax=Chionoecetes opilio TaxID=41210 RepID=A0A8J4YFC3_CHIOP|nr:hypothetical protein GWK47_005645 [Chionoecetes opilio]
MPKYDAPYLKRPIVKKPPQQHLQPIMSKTEETSLDLGSRITFGNMPSYSSTTTHHRLLGLLTAHHCADATRPPVFLMFPAWGRAVQGQSARRGTTFMAALGILFIFFMFLFLGKDHTTIAYSNLGQTTATINFIHPSGRLTRVASTSFRRCGGPGPPVVALSLRKKHYNQPADCRSGYRLARQGEGRIERGETPLSKKRVLPSQKSLKSGHSGLLPSDVKTVAGTSSWSLLRRCVCNVKLSFMTHLLYDKDHVLCLNCGDSERSLKFLIAFGNSNA